jgi:hypothetical protein
MPTLTPARLALLQAVSEDRVSGYKTSPRARTPWRIDLTPRPYGHADGAGAAKTVTKQVEALESAGLVKLGKRQWISFYARHPYLLTDAGREALESAS